LVLAILDGWGIAPKSPSNPIRAANTPVLDGLISSYPTITLRASGEVVGLSHGEVGNSEVGHLTIGAGRVFYQALPRINFAIENGDFFRNGKFMEAAATIKAGGKRLHIVGVASDGNVHGSIEHIEHLLVFAKRHGLRHVALHLILDGRDVPYDSGIDYVQRLEKKLRLLQVGEIASVSGRYYAMDRDSRWERTAKAYAAMMGTGQPFDGLASEAIRRSYQVIDKVSLARTFDEEFIPITILKDGKPVAPLSEGDAVIFTNYRPDRIRQLCTALTMRDFSGFERGTLPNLHVVTMTEYEKNLPVSVAFPAEPIGNCLSQVLADAGLRQLRVAETEKYAHVTYFFNGMTETAFPGEERVILPSPHVVSYDLQPEMSAPQITQAIIDDLAAERRDFYVINYANADMVGHTGKFEATQRAVETVDACIGKLAEATLAADGLLMITADHGNGEELLDLRGGEIEIDKEHNPNPVPFIAVGKKWKGVIPPSGEEVSSPFIGGDLSILPTVGTLADIAPTILKVLGIKKPPEMTGHSLL
jgi:2,3-bisphosphoglycerate-independent phosphoglycerate mutase